MTFFRQIAKPIATHRSRAHSCRVTTADANPKLAHQLSTVSLRGTAGVVADPRRRPGIPRVVARVTLAVALLTGLVPLAAADVLVSNVEQRHTSAVALDSAVNARAQAFRTGSGTTLLSSVDVAFHSGPATTEDLTVTIRANRFGNPGAIVATLTNPDDVSSEGAKPFTAPSGTVLSPRTPYWVHVERNSGTSFEVSGTDSNSLDQGRLAGWSMGGTSKFRNDSGHWATAGGSVAMRIRVNGSAAPALSTAAVTDRDLVLTYDADLDPATAPNLDRFAVTVNGTRQTLRWVTFYGADLRLKLEVPAISGETVQVSYDPPPSNGLQDIHGRQVLSFTDREVDNESADLPQRPTRGRVLAGVPDPRAGSSSGWATTTTPERPFITRKPVRSPIPRCHRRRHLAPDHPSPGRRPPAVAGRRDDRVRGRSRAGCGRLDSAHRRRGSGSRRRMEVVYPDTWFRWDSGAPEWPNDSKLNDRVSVSLRKAVRDDRGPQLVGLVAVNGGDTLELTYDEVLDAHSTPAPSDFTVHFQGPSTGHEDGTGHGMCG